MVHGHDELLLHHSGFLDQIVEPMSLGIVSNIGKIQAFRAVPMNQVQSSIALEGQCQLAVILIEYSVKRHTWE